MTGHRTRPEVPTQTRLHQAANAFMAGMEVPDPDLAAIRCRVRHARRPTAKRLRGLAWQVPAAAAVAAGLLFSLRVGPFGPAASSRHSAELGAVAGPSSLHGHTPALNGPATPTSTAPNVPTSFALLVFAGRPYRLVRPDAAAGHGPRLGTGHLLGIGRLPAPGSHASFEPLRPTKSQASNSGSVSVPTAVYRLSGHAAGPDLLVRIPPAIAAAVRLPDGQRNSGGLWVAVPVAARPTVPTTPGKAARP